MILHEDIPGYHLCERTLTEDGEVAWWGRYTDDWPVSCIRPDGSTIVCTGTLYLFPTREDLEEAICLHRLKMAATP